MESKKAFGAVSFDVSCLERTLFVLIPEKYIGKEKEILVNYSHNPTRSLA